MRHLQGDIIIHLCRKVADYARLKLGKTTVSKLKMMRCMEQRSFGDERMHDTVVWYVKRPIEDWLNENCPNRWRHRIDYDRGLCEFHFLRKGDATLFALTWR